MMDALAFYTGVLDFELIYPEDAEGDVADLGRDGAELQLTIYESDKLFGSVANIWVNEVDSLFEKYQARGLDTSNKEGSPVHQGPIDQNWGRREFYVTDSDNNTLRFCKRI
jgi:hypothetical protein